MGGLVIKRAYILARQSQEFELLAHRVRAMFFLATPHRGADVARLLSKILSVAPGARPFVTDLNRNSLATQSINDEFPHVCRDLQLYSFYETMATNYGIGKSLIVAKDLATLGYHNERTAYLNANHRDICKYATPTDPNYQTVRNALASLIDTFRSHAVSLKHSLDNEQRQLLRGFLDVSDTSEDDFLGIDALRMRGSCEWLLNKEGFRGWRDSVDRPLYWINAKPGTGKSVLSAFIIQHLRDLYRGCSFHFFTHGNETKSTIDFFLRSMAWQMASLHPKVMHVILEICRKDGPLDKTSYRAIWRRIFVNGILKLELDQPLYWVVDALDECEADLELVPLLAKITEMCPVRIVVTSRNNYELYRPKIYPSFNVIPGAILIEDTKSDILLYLRANMFHLPSVDEGAQQEMVTQILDKSAGCFLWVSLVLHQLGQAHTSAETRQVLENITSDMDKLYSRIVDGMSKASYGKSLAKAILAWTVCSSRPLTVQELDHALQLDMKDNVYSIQKAIESSCGQLVHVDAQLRVQMVHQTAREYILRPSNASEFAIDRASAQKRLAMTCLQYLNGDEMESPRHRNLSVSETARERCPFVDYACNSLFEHVAHVPSPDRELLVALARFFRKSNVLCWIEYLAQHSDLNRLIQTGGVIKNCLQRLSNQETPLHQEIATLSSWATDLIRLVTKFGKILAMSPSSIFHLIPPFCPPDTALRRLFGASTCGIVVLGLSATSWDDCLSTKVFYQEKPAALACSDVHFAVGLSSGRVVIYDQTTCQKARTLIHQEPVKILQFGITGKVLASSGATVVRVWDITSWQQRWSFDIPKQCMSLALTDGDRLLLGALKNNHLITWNLTTGRLKNLTDFTQNLGGVRKYASRCPTAATFGLELNLLAVVYRGQDILFWDLERDAFYESYAQDVGVCSVKSKVARPFVVSLVFNLGPVAKLLAAAYSDGSLVLFDISIGTVKATRIVNAHTLASSPDGRTLASVDSSGTIFLFNFETLEVVDRLYSGGDAVKSLAFSGFSHRLYDITDSKCRVWHPIGLDRQVVDGEKNGAVPTATTLEKTGSNISIDIVMITALTHYRNGEAILCGKEDGSVSLYETKSGRQTQTLISHANGCPIRWLFIDEESETLSSTDLSNRLVVRKLLRQQDTWGATEPWLDHRVHDAGLEQLLANRGHTRLLVSSAHLDTLYSIAPNGSAVITTLSWPHRLSDTWKWGNHPSDRHCLFLITHNAVHLYEWQTLNRLTRDEGILLEGRLLYEPVVRSVVPCFNGTVVAMQFAQSLDIYARMSLSFWEISDFTRESVLATSLRKYQFLTEQVVYVIGAYGSQRLIFVNHGDWVCSIDSETGEVMHHFFIPTDWMNSNPELIIDVACNGDIIFVKGNELAVIKYGLNTSKQEQYLYGNETNRRWLRQHSFNSVS